MTDVTAIEFLEILKDPAMADAKAKLVEVLRNPNTYVLEISVSSFSPHETTMTIKLQV